MRYIYRTRWLRRNIIWPWSGP